MRYLYTCRACGSQHEARDGQRGPYGELLRPHYCDHCGSTVLDAAPINRTLVERALLWVAERGIAL